MNLREALERSEELRSRARSLREEADALEWEAGELEADATGVRTGEILTLRKLVELIQQISREAV